VVRTSTPMPDVIYEMNRKGLGMSCVVDEQSRLAGIITDGDLRRRMSDGTNILSLAAGDIMTRKPVTVSPDTLAAEALHLLETRKITSIVVVDEGTVVQGVVHLHNLWRTGMV
jgi:arabinose-5-phosphate isomerase